MKQKLVNFLEFAGLTWFVPLVKLCFNDEPKEQVREVVRMLGLPAIALVIFFGAWSLMSQHIRTSVGALPTPSFVWSQAKGMWAFHKSEQINKGEFTYYNEIRTELNENFIARETATGSLLEKIDAERAKLVNTLKNEIATREKSIAELDVVVKAAQKEKADSIATLKESLIAKKLFVQDEAGLTVTGEDGSPKLNEEAMLKIAEIERVSVAVFERNALAYYTNGASSLKSLVKKAERINGYIAQSVALNAKAELTAAEQKKLKVLGKKKNAYLKQLTKEKEYSGNGTIVDYINTSIITVLFGFFLAAFVAIPMGILCGLSKTIMTALNPLIQTFRPVSPLAWVLITIQIVDGIFVGDKALTGEIVKNTFLHAGITVALCSLWATLSNTALGVSSVDPDHMNVAKVLKLSWTDKVFKIVVPSAVPYIFTGLRITLGVGWMVLIVSEMMATSRGLGWFIDQEYQNNKVESLANIIVCIFIVGLIGALLDRIMFVLQKSVSFNEDEVSA